MTFHYLFPGITTTYSVRNTVLGISERRRVKDFKVGSVVGERIQGYGDGDGRVKQPLVLP